MQLFGEDVYMHQFKINGKMAFDGDVWQWHQDYGTWKNDDLMPEARAMNVAIFLDDVNEFNGPLMFIPGSHKRGVLDAQHDLTHHQLSALDDRQRHDRQAGRAAGGGGGIVAPKGPAGLDDPVPRLPGARSTATSRRGTASASTCACAPCRNHIRRFKRPEYIAHRDFTPIECLPDDCLLKRLRRGAAVEGRHAGERAAELAELIDRKC